MQRERRERVASYATYRDAQAAVDTLSERGFPVERQSIVAEDLRLVKDIAGRRGCSAAVGQSLLARLRNGAQAASPSSSRSRACQKGRRMSTKLVPPGHRSGS